MRCRCRLIFACDGRRSLVARSFGSRRACAPRARRRPDRGRLPHRESVGMLAGVGPARCFAGRILCAPDNYNCLLRDRREDEYDAHRYGCGAAREGRVRRDPVSLRFEWRSGNASLAEMANLAPERSSISANASTSTRSRSGRATLRRKGHSSRSRERLGVRLLSIFAGQSPGERAALRNRWHRSEGHVSIRPC